MTDIRVRFKNDPNRFVWLTLAEYHARVDEIIKPYDPNRPVRPWPDLTGMYVEDPGRLGRFRFIATDEEE